jgi:DNA-binding NarL/FixJ family response regulator
MARRQRTPQLIGREGALRQLGAAIDHVGDGAGSLVLMSGEAGIGKTRLLEEFAARSPEALVARGGCVEDVAYAPWTDALWWLLDSLGSGVVEELPAHVGPQLARLIPSLTAVDLTSDQEADGQQLLFDAIVELLRHVGAKRPLVVVVDDVHWIDPASRDVLRYVASNLRRIPIMLVVAYRGEEVVERDLLAQLGRLADDRLALDRLPEAATTEIASILLGDEADADALERITRDADGNPLFVEELVAAVEAKGMPETLRDLMLARFSSLDDDARALVSVAAVIGNRAPRAWLVYASGLSKDRAKAAARAAADAGVLVAVDGGYEFRHALLRQAVLDDLLPDEVVDLHRSAAAALTDHPDAGVSIDRTAELARHWDAAEEPEPALKWLVAAAKHAYENYAFEASLHDYERALVWWDSVPQPESAAGVDRATVLLNAADAAGFAGSIDRAAELGREGLDESFALDQSRGVEAAGRVSPLFWNANRAEELTKFIDERVLGVLGEVDPKVRARFLVGRVFDLARRATAEEMREPAAEMMAALDVIDDPVLEARAHMVNAWTLEAHGEFDLVDAEYETAAKLAREADAHSMLAIVLSNHASAKSWIPDWDGCITLLDEVDALNERFGLRRNLAPIAAMRVIATCFVGDVPGANSALGRMEGLELEGLDRWAKSLSRARIEVIVGSYDAAADGLADEFTFDLEDPEAVVESATLRADALAWTKDVDGARRAVDLAQAVIEEHRDAYWHGLLAMVGVRVEADAAAAATNSVEAIESAEARGAALVASWKETLASLKHTVGLVDGFSRAIDAEWARIVDESVVEKSQAAAAMFEDFSMPYYATYFRWREAEAMLLKGERPAATEVLKRARAVALSHGFRGLEDAINGLARTNQLRLGPAKTNVDGDEALSVRELEVLRLLVEGRSNPEIAEELFITRRTAAAHVSNILKKLDASSRAEAASEAVRRGYV